MAYQFKKLSMSGLGVEDATNADIYMLEFLKFMTKSPANGGPGWILKAYGMGYIDKTNSTVGSYQLNGNYDPAIVWSAGTAIGVNGGFGNAGNWFILQEPAVTGGHRREFLFQTGRATARNSTTFINYAGFRGLAHVYYSAQGFLTTATGNGQNSTDVTGINPPIAYDQLRVTDYTMRTPMDTAYNYVNPDGRGAITCQLQAFYLINYFGGINSAENNQIVFCAADNASGEGYGWYILHYIITNNGANGFKFISYDPLKPGTYDSSDPDPVVITQSTIDRGAGGAGFASFLSGYSSPVAFFPSPVDTSDSTNRVVGWAKRPATFTSKADVSSQFTANTASSNIVCPAVAYGMTTAKYVLTMGGKPTLMNVPYVFNGTVAGVTGGHWKGESSMTKYVIQNNLYPLTTLSVGGILRSHIHVQKGIVLPWDGSVPVI
jgi:hypothetical protein